MPIKSRFIPVAVLLAAAMLFLNASKVKAQEGNVSAKTQSFIENATSGNNFEIQSSKTALDKSKNDAVRSFAQKMINDHTKAGNDMTATLKKANIPALVNPDMLAQKHQDVLNSLKNETSGFDQAYIDAQTKAHDETVSLFEDYAENGDNPDVKTFARNTLPTLKEHRDHIKEMKPTQ